MPRPAVADFVDSFFIRALFQKDDTVAKATLDSELSSDAEININGNLLNAETFISVITNQFRGAFTASIVKIQDLNILPTNGLGSTGLVAQYTSYETQGKVDGTVLTQSATTIVKVDERNGQQVVTALWEAQTEDSA